jgi:hypothetical protein
MMRTPTPALVRPLFPPYFARILNCTPASTEPHISPATPHLRHMLRSATRREDWVLLRDTPHGWAPPSPTAAPRQPSSIGAPARSRTVDFTSRRRSSSRGQQPGSAEPEVDDSAVPVTTSSPLSEHDSSALPVPPRAATPQRARPAPESGRGWGHPRSRARARARHHKRTRGRSARSSRGCPPMRSSRSRHRRRPICAVHALHRACAVAACGHPNRC